MSPFVVLIPIGLLIAVLRIVRPAPHRDAGQPLLVHRLPLLARARLHAVPAGLLLGYALVLFASGEAPLWVVLASLAALTCLVAWRISYNLTTTGISLGHTGLRRWTEFAGVVRAPGGVRLQGGAGGRGFRIWLSGSRGDDEFILLLRQMIKGAYQGRDAVPRRPAAEVQSSDDRSPRQEEFDLHANAVDLR